METAMKGGGSFRDIFLLEIYHCAKNGTTSVPLKVVKDLPSYTNSDYRTLLYDGRIRKDPISGKIFISEGGFAYFDRHPGKIATTTFVQVTLDQGMVELMNLSPPLTPQVTRFPCVSVPIAQNS
jgi:hypothetical protein